MNTYFLSRKCLVGLLGFFAVLIVGVLAAAAADALEIVRFDANPVNELVPGTELVFRLEGTPQAKAIVTISSIRQPITLRETNTGFYEGSYTIRTGDRLPSNPDVRATLRQGNLTTTARLTQPLVTAAQTPSRGLDIQRFTMEPNRIEPGTELVFTLEGTPNATATFGIRDITRDITMTEVQPGVYEGRYTVRQQDMFSANNVSARLEANGKMARARLATSAQQAAQTRNVRPSEQAGFSLEVTSHRDMAEVLKGSIEVRGRSAPNLPLNVRVEATNALGGLIGAKQSILSSTVTTDERGNFTFRFESPSITMPGTRYEVNISGQWAGEEKSKQLTLVQR